MVLGGSLLSPSAPLNASTRYVKLDDLTIFPLLSPIYCCSRMFLFGGRLLVGKIVFLGMLKDMVC